MKHDNENKELIPNTDLIPTKISMQKSYWFLPVGILSENQFRKALSIVSKVTFDSNEMEFIFYVSVSNLLIELELFSFDYTPAMVRIIKQHLIFLKILCCKQKKSMFFLTVDYVSKLAAVFDSLLSLKRWRFVEQQICLDQIQKTTQFLRHRINCWFQSNQLKAFLWRWNFRNEINSIIYYSFLIPKVKKYITVMKENAECYIEKMETRCNCYVKINYDLGFFMSEYEYFVMEVVFDTQIGRPLGFLDMLNYLVKQIHLSKYFLKSLRTILLKDSHEFVFISDAPVKSLKILGKQLKNGQSIEPFLSEFNCTKKAMKRTKIKRDRSADSLQSTDSTDTSDTNSLIHLNWTTEYDALNYWKERIDKNSLAEYKCELQNFNIAFVYWDSIFKKITKNSESSPNKGKMDKRIKKLIKECEETNPSPTVNRETQKTLMVIGNMTHCKMKPTAVSKLFSNITDILYEQVFAEDPGESYHIPSMKTMRAMTHRQTGPDDAVARRFWNKHRKPSVRNSLLTLEAIGHLKQSSFRINNSLIISNKYQLSISHKENSDNTLVDLLNFSRKMDDRSISIEEDLPDHFVWRFRPLLQIKYNNFSSELKSVWDNILVAVTHWENFEHEMKEFEEQKFSCSVEYYVNFKKTYPLPSSIIDIPLISIYITLQMLTDNTLVYTSHFKQLNDGFNIDIPLIMKVNKSPNKPVLFGYLNCKEIWTPTKKLQILLCQMAFDLFLCTLKKVEAIMVIFMQHSESFKSCLSEIKKKSLTTIIQMSGIVNLLEIQQKRILNFNSNALKLNEKLLECSNQLLFLYEFLFGKKCCSWIEFKYFGIRVIYHSLFIDGSLRCNEPFLRLPGDRRVRKIEHFCKCIIVLRDTVHPVLKTTRYMVEIYYDFFSGNHFGSIELLSNMLQETYGNVVKFQPHRSLVCFPSGELWVLSDVEWLKTINI